MTDDYEIEITTLGCELRCFALFWCRIVSLFVGFGIEIEWAEQVFGFDRRVEKVGRVNNLGGGEEGNAFVDVTGIRTCLIDQVLCMFVRLHVFTNQISIELTNSVGVLYVGMRMKFGCIILTRWEWDVKGF